MENIIHKIDSYIANHPADKTPLPEARAEIASLKDLIKTHENSIVMWKDENVKLKDTIARRNKQITDLRGQKNKTKKELQDIHSCFKTGRHLKNKPEFSTKDWFLWAERMWKTTGGSRVFLPKWFKLEMKNRGY